MLQQLDNFGDYVINDKVMQAWLLAEAAVCMSQDPCEMLIYTTCSCRRTGKLAHPYFLSKRKTAQTTYVKLYLTGT